MGTAVGTEVFIDHGWRAGAALSMAWSGWQFFVLFLRGPHCDRKTWLGFQGGLKPYKIVPRAPQGDEEAANPRNEMVEESSSSEKREESIEDAGASTAIETPVNDEKSL